MGMIIIRSIEQEEEIKVGMLCTYAVPSFKKVDMFQGIIVFVGGRGQVGVRI
jgi:hypothetical protein